MNIQGKIDTKAEVLSHLWELVRDARLTKDDETIRAAERAYNSYALLCVLPTSNFHAPGESDENSRS